MIFIMIVVTIIGIFMAIYYLLIYTLGFLYISNSGSANAQLLGCFCCFLLFHILMPYNIYFIFVYLIFMSLIVLYFLHSTSVFSFCIDVILALSIETCNNYYRKPYADNAIVTKYNSYTLTIQTNVLHGCRPTLTHVCLYKWNTSIQFSM